MLFTCCLWADSFSYVVQFIYVFFCPAQLVIDANIPHTLNDKGKAVSHEEVGDFSGKLSEIVPTPVSLDDVSSGEGFIIHSDMDSVSAGGSRNKTAKRLKLRSVKIEKE